MKIWYAVTVDGATYPEKPYEASMKISELVKRTGVPKETIHFYIRQGILRKPRKSSINAAEYNEGYVKQIQLIKELRDNYYLPIPEIKKFVRNFKKQSASDKAISQFHTKFFRPAERLLAEEISGQDEFCRATGLGRKWLKKAEEWGVITPENRNGITVYSVDDVAIGKLMVDMDNLGFGPKDGGNPEDLRHIADFVKNFVVKAFKNYYQNNLEILSSAESVEKGNLFHELISLFFYHIYRKQARLAARDLIKALQAEPGRPK